MSLNNQTVLLTLQLLIFINISYQSKHQVFKKIIWVVISISIANKNDTHKLIFCRKYIFVFIEYQPGISRYGNEAISKVCYKKGHILSLVTLCRMVGRKCCVIDFLTDTDIIIPKMAPVVSYISNYFLKKYCYCLLTA